MSTCSFTSPPGDPFLRTGFDQAAQVAGAIRLENVATRGIDWLWPQRVPIGKVTLLVGDPGLGKSLVAVDIAARVSRGASWPDECDQHETQSQKPEFRTLNPPTSGPPPSPLRPPPSSVLLLSAEDDLADTIRPRLEAAGADCSRIVAVPSILGSDPASAVPRAHELQRDLARLRGLVNTLGDCRLLIVDPISGYLGGGESSSAGVRDLLVPLALLAQERQLAVVAISHLRKKDGAAVYRTTGSLAFVALARAVWIISADPENARRRLMLPMKNNLAAGATGLAYTIESTAEPRDNRSEQPETYVSPEMNRPPIVRWSPDSIAMSVDVALAKPSRRMGRPDEERQKAIHWLRQTLADKGLPSNEIIDRAEELGFCQVTIRRAFRDTGGVAIREGFGPLGVWFWKLPAIDDQKSGGGD